MTEYDIDDILSNFVRYFNRCVKGQPEAAPEKPLQRAFKEKLTMNLMDELRIKIIDTLNLEEVVPDDIGEDDQLIGGDLGLDSIDVLELVMMIEKDYSVRIDNKELGARVFRSLRTLTEYIAEESPRVQ